VDFLRETPQWRENAGEPLARRSIVLANHRIKEDHLVRIIE